MAGYRIVLAVSIAFALAGAAASGAYAATLAADIKGMAFASPVTPMHVNDVINWTNHDFVAHTVTARDGSFDVVIAPGKTGSITLKHAGKIAFFCRFHPTMKGVIDAAP